MTEDDDKPQSFEKGKEMMDEYTMQLSEENRKLKSANDKFGNLYAAHQHCISMEKSATDRITANIPPVAVVRSMVDDFMRLSEIVGCDWYETIMIAIKWSGKDIQDAVLEDLKSHEETGKWPE